MRMRFLIVLIVISSLCPLNVFGGDVTYTGTHITGLHKWMYIQPLTGPRSYKAYVVNGLSFDPTQKSVDGNYNKIYWVSQVDFNDVLEGELTTEGLYLTDIYSGITSYKLALAGYDMPQDTAVDANGVVYAMSGDDVEFIYKITNASSGDGTIVQMLANNYSGISDDDPIGIGMVPENFGGGYEAGKDIVLFDTGFTNNNYTAIHIVDKTSLAATPTYTTLWQYGGNSGSYIRGAVNYFDGFAYFARRTIPTADSGSGTKKYINRIKGDGVLQRIFLDVNGGTLLSTALDDSITVNPVDGSVWFVVADESTNRYIYRIDIANASLLSSNNYLATTTLEITFTADENMNVGINDMAISPDGKFLAVANPSGTDKLWVFNIVPEPTTLAIFTVAGLFASFRRRK